MGSGKWEAVTLISPEEVSVLLYRDEIILYLEKTFCFLSLSKSIICLRRNHPPGSCSNATVSSFLPLQVGPCTWISWPACWCWAGYNDPGQCLCCAIADFLSWYRRMSWWWWSLNLILIEWQVCPIYTYPNLQSMLHMSNDIGLKIPDISSSLCECRKLYKLLFHWKQN